MAASTMTEEEKRAQNQHMVLTISSLANPNEPQHCGQCLRTLLLCIRIDEGRIPLVVAKKTHFWKVLYGFVTEPRTDEQVEALLRRLSRCSCSISDNRIRALHRMAEEYPEPEMGIIRRSMTMELAPEHKKPHYATKRIGLVLTIFELLCSSLMEPNVKAIAKGQTQTWPRTPLDLMPHGADELAQILLQWYRFIPNPIIFMLAARIMKTCQHLIIPSIARVGFSREVVLRGKEVVKIIEPYIHSPIKEHYATRIANMFEWNLSCIVDYFDVVWVALSVDARQELLAGVETKAMQIFALFSFLQTNRRLDRVIRDPELLLETHMFCHQIYRFFHMHLHPHPDYPVAQSMRELDEDDFSHSPDSMFFPIIVASNIGLFRQDMRCFAYGCPQSMQSVGADFQRCGRCQVVSYCGTACQARAWKEELYPHKRICPILTRLVQLAGGLDLFRPLTSSIETIDSMWVIYSAMSEEWRSAQVDQEKVKYVYDWMTWFQSPPNRALPDPPAQSPGFEDYNEVVERIGQPYVFLNRLTRSPGEEAKVRAGFEDLPFRQHSDIDGFAEPVPLSF